MSVNFYEMTLCSIPEDSNLHTRRRENLTYVPEKYRPYLKLNPATHRAASHPGANSKLRTQLWNTCSHSCIKNKDDNVVLYRYQSPSIIPSTVYSN
jgi:hypothetical protein